MLNGQISNIARTLHNGSERLSHGRDCRGQEYPIINNKEWCDNDNQILLEIVEMANATGDDGATKSGDNANQI